MDAYFSDDDIDEAIDGAFQRWHDCLTKAGVIKPSKTIAACEQIVGGAGVAKQIKIAAEAAHEGWDVWAARARRRAGY